MSVDKCVRHQKLLTTNCMWCGKRLCKQCIARKEGNKTYCQRCAEKLGPVPRIVPQMRPGSQTA